MIQQIEISRFKNIDHLELPLRNINILIGANNAGKSSILQAIQFAVSIAQTTNLERTARWIKETDKLPISLTPNQLIYAPLRDVYSLAKGGILKTDESSAIKVLFRDDELENSSIIIRKGKNKNISIEIFHKKLGDKLRNIEAPFSIYVPGLAGIPAFEELKSPGIIRRAAARGDANNVFRNILWLLHKSDVEWKQFLNDLQSIFPGVELKVSFDTEKDEYLDIQIQKQNVSLPIDAAGTGFLQIVQILSYINLYKPRLLLLDEPDAHLHPDNQRKLAQKLLHISESRGIQIIISTHSRHLYDQLEEHAQICWISNGALNNEEHIETRDVLMRLGALDKIDITNGVKTKLIVLTEDTKQEPLKTILEASGIPLEETEILSYNGCSDVKTANILVEYIHKHHPRIATIIHRDRDYNSDEEIDKIKNSYSQDIKMAFITDGTDIESYFINASHIQALYPKDLTNEEAENLVNQAIEMTKDDSIDKYMNVLCDHSLQVKQGHKAAQNSRKAQTDYTNNPKRFTHGKTAANTLKALLQKHLKRNVLLYQPTEFISIPNLMKLRKSIWKQ